MKRFVACCFVVLVLVGSCAAQSANNAQSVDNAQRILGTWVDNETGETWVFNADGTVTGYGDIGSYSSANDSFEGKFGVADTKLAILGDERNSYIIGYNISISPDGKTLIFILDNGRGSSGYLEDVYWFTKQ
ncbi:MAG: hypothetical protein LBF95_02425 [Treponema sp.]|jgi:hypothetical protein|nr:hypothetical protein [Treponema sp.]